MVVCYTISPDTKENILQQDYIKLDQTCINPSENGCSVSFSPQGDIIVDENPSLAINKSGLFTYSGEKKIFIKPVDQSRELSSAQLSDQNYIGRSDYFHFWNLGFDIKDMEISINCSGVDFKLMNVGEFRPMIMTVYVWRPRRGLRENAKHFRLPEVVLESPLGDCRKGLKLLAHLSLNDHYWSSKSKTGS